MGTFQMMHALKPEPERPSDARSGRFFRCVSPRESGTSLGKTAECVADGLGEGCGLSFLFASFSLDSKEKDDEKMLAFQQRVGACHLCSVWPCRERMDPGLEMTHCNVGTYTEIVATSLKMRERS